MTSITENDTDLIKKAFACSNYLAALCERDDTVLTTLLNGQGTPYLEEALHLKALEAFTEHCDSEVHLMSALRAYHAQHTARIIWYDVIVQQPIKHSLTQVSVLANAIILTAYNWLYTSLTQRYGIPQARQPMCILAMGKLGGHELNFSSDIDLIFAYPEKGETHGGRKQVEHQVFFTKLAQKLIHVLDTVTTEGRLYRVDMRLRPFGESGPLVAHFDALEDYYHEQAREWERFALMKARIINPPTKDTDTLYNIIRPFVYKKYLDFTTLDALRDIKQMINAETRRRRLANNIKLGRGGIREAEFFVQCFQMIHGGRHPSLQVKNWLKACEKLAQEGHIATETQQAITQAYCVLRKVEHALQQVNNEQTQSLPTDPLHWQKIVLSTGYESQASLEHDIAKARETIHDLFAELFAQPDEDVDTESALYQFCVDAWQLDLSEQELNDTGQSVIDTHLVSQFHTIISGLKKTVLTSRAGTRGRQQLDKLIPLILEAFLENEDKDFVVLERIFALIHAVLGRTTYLDLLLENPDVRKQLFHLCQLSPWIADQLRQFPLLLDELLAPIYLHNQTTDLEASRQEYIGELRQVLLRIDPDDEEQHMDVLRQFKLCQQLRIAAADILGTLPVEKVSDKLTMLAEVLLTHVINTALHQMAKRYGLPEYHDIPGHGFAALAYGKMGGWELGYGSDLDLVFIHNAPADSQTTGAKQISAQQFYIKVAQRIMHLLNTKTIFGELYDTDLRLRPSGNAGLFCCHVDGFTHYQNNDAWTWEHQALVRARAVFGETELIEKFNLTRQAILCKTRDVEALKIEVSDMRRKLFEHWQSEKGKQSFKHGTGGITDIEFLSQYWVLAYSHQDTSLTKWQDNLRIIDAASSTSLISAEQADVLKKAYLCQRNALHHSTLLGKLDQAESAEIKHMRKAVSEVWQAILPPYSADE
ncbi:bifunctional [glutamate--ammonia ligase]-adenylyl-L-tyrosine phosphorylase/[glutamate--ammonia-ligase] adenylyltransferase [Alteromonas sediminis]|uniref:Bifunctional glutamine synthetase adenylyltransferase/adenylyl-removing enzyme n=1 Tax=Alteromonas sediminis TaxID=2259342 RepID=A0A3N5YAN7_9ALTE|nr:bifunctional [glutamate--ammonia ligase]-adenylyl-L-tyrosine phosphorylase/[glutamate--ammonia-ligase] adenylyltransferase [Alteromonas sediminis]RPJ65885.1 bifunctional [glutamate--ammonia ligase]-adenylyl-L-tyrosine phosphorylase/[glutamate--ammonia-ligase] adenylyltransferase [Alteromonas sediminis]